MSRWTIFLALFGFVFCRSTSLLAQELQQPLPGLEPPPAATATAVSGSREVQLEDRVRELEETNRRLLEQVEALAKQYESISEKLGPAPERSPEDSRPVPRLVPHDPAVERVELQVADPVVNQPMPPIPSPVLGGSGEEPPPPPPSAGSVFLPPALPDAPLSNPANPLEPIDLPEVFPELGQFAQTNEELAEGTQIASTGRGGVGRSRAFPFFGGSAPSSDPDAQGRRFREDLPEIFPRLERDEQMPLGLPRMSIPSFGINFPAFAPAETYQPNGVREDLPELLPQIDRDAEVPPYIVGYDNGFFLRPVDPEASPFELQLGGRLQFRHIAFVNTRRFWTDNAGITRPIARRNDFEIERGRITFAGYILDPDLQFYLNIDGGTDLGHQLFILDFWANYRFSQAFNFYAGKAYVPGSREYLDGSARMRFVDRSLATTFFRPGRSVGVWAIGQPWNGVNYRAMIANAYRSADLSFLELDRELVFASSFWWDVFDNFGAGIPDLQWHETPAFRIGTSMTHASQGRLPAFQPSGEVDFVRLTDGTRLTQTGALAPGVTVDRFLINLFAVDFAAKYRGFGFYTEYYFRMLDNIQADGPLPVKSIYDRGFTAEIGYFIIPKHLEIGGRMSRITGQFGTGGEYAGAMTWYVRGSHTWKVTFDASRVFNTPTSNFNTNYRAGDTGFLFRTQLQVAF